MISLLGSHGVASEQSLLFSLCFGLVLAIGSLPGALAWLLYAIAPLRRIAGRALVPGDAQAQKAATLERQERRNRHP